MLEFENKNILVGFCYAFCGTMLFSLKSIFIKLAYEQGLNADSVLMLRMAIALPIYLGLIIYLLNKDKSSKTAIKKTGAIFYY